MKQSESLKEFRKSIARRLKRAGFRQRIIDEFNINCLERYRIAAAFALPLLKLSVTERVYPRELIDGCERILADDRVFMLSGKKNPAHSRELEKAVENADKLISQVGNFLNNHHLLAKPILEELFLEARNLCDLATKRMTIRS